MNRWSKHYDCPHCGPGWAKLPDPPEPPNEILSYWVAIGKEPTENEKIDLLTQDVADIERRVKDLREDLSDLPSLDRDIKSLRERLDAMP